MSKMLSVRVDDATADKLDWLAAHDASTVSDTLRNAVADYLADHLIDERKAAELIQDAMKKLQDAKWDLKQQQYATNEMKTQFDDVDPRVIDAAKFVLEHSRTDLKAKEQAATDAETAYHQLVNNLSGPLGTWTPKPGLYDDLSNVGYEEPEQYQPPKDQNPSAPSSHRPH